MGINQRSIDTVRGARLDDLHTRPLYSSYCFARIPGTIQAVLAGQPDQGDQSVQADSALPSDVLGELDGQYEQVITIVIDAFGWRFVEPLLKSGAPFLNAFGDKGVVSLLTSQFPSTTSAHMTTFHSGLPVGQTGVFEWFYYEPLVDRMIVPLLYSYAGEEQPELFKTIKAPPEKLYPTRTIHQALAEIGVRSFCYQSQDYARSTYSRTMLQGAQIVPFKSYTEALVNLTDSVLNSPDKTHHFLYIDVIDTLLHRYGPGAPQVAAETGIMLTALEKFLHQGLSGRAKRTLLLVSADHGQIEVDPGRTLYLDQLDPSLADLMRTDKRGQALVPGGSSRDMFVYVKPGRIDEAYARLTALLAGQAEVRRVPDLIAQGYFGIPGANNPSPAFLSRVSDLVILPRPGQMVWWYGDGRYEQKFRGHHGGLTSQEMEIPLLALGYR